MCEYCENEKFEKRHKNELYKNFPIKDDYTEKYIDTNKDNTPIQYIRKNSNKYFLITELINEDGDVISADINYCPMCGRKLNQ